MSSFKFGVIRILNDILLHPIDSSDNSSIARFLSHFRCTNEHRYLAHSRFRSFTTLRFVAGGGFHGKLSNFIIRARKPHRSEERYWVATRN